MIIYNARVITWEEENRVLENHAVVIQGKLIKDLGPSDEMLKKYPDEEIKAHSRGRHLHDYLLKNAVTFD